MTSKPSSTDFIREAVIAIKNAIDANPLNRKAAQELVQDIYIGRNQLQNTFKQISGITMRSYRLQKRMEAARDILSSGENSVKQVALKCGYRNQNNFTADFKVVFKITPAEWLRDHFDDVTLAVMKVQFS